MNRTFFFFAAAAVALASPAFAQEAHQAHMHSAPTQTQSMDQMDMDDMDMPDMGAMQMAGALGAYAGGRDASGTSWQPDASPMDGAMTMRGPWMLMGHARLNGVYDWQGGPRGDEKTFVSGMVMGMAQRTLGDGTLMLHAMLSPDPFMGARGYPQLLSQGETADGTTPLVDRQHPHDLFMELSASYAHPITDADSVFVYAGLPGEPAFGPPAFMHRLSAMDSPEAPITHHWLDSTHITFGVVTAGWVHDNWKIEASRFRGREPDEHRYDIETGELDSTAARVSWNPNENWALQVSWADVTNPETLEPDLDETRWSASAIYMRRIGAEGWWSTTGAFGRKQRSDGVDTDAWTLESAYHPNEQWTLFARAERLETDELEVGPVETVGRVSAGAIRDWRVNEHAVFGVGALVEQTFIPSALDSAYGGDPRGAMGFVRLKLS
ncbi:MAG TPA: hypothetical protein VG943_02205 [Caulobacterales bacterium]|nr:hypothetical protein [Caulobacterales bacterium]